MPERAGQRGYLEGRAHDYGEGAHGAGVELVEVVARDILDDLSSALGLGAIGQDYRTPDEPVAGGAVGQPPRSGDSRGQTSPNGAAVGQRDLQWQILALFRQPLLQPA